MKMQKKTKLQKLLKVFQPAESKIDFSPFDTQVEALKTQLKEKVQVQTLEDVNNQLDRFRRRISLQPLTDSINQIRDSIDQKLVTLTSEVENRTEELDSLIAQKDKNQETRIKELQSELRTLKQEQSGLEDARQKDIERMLKSIPDLSDLENRLAEMMIEVSSRVDVLENEEPQEIKDWTETIEKLRQEFNSRLANIGGGNMNRQIRVEGVDVLTRFTDINLTSAGGSPITAAVDSANKRVNITFPAGGGSGTPSVGGAITGGRDQAVLFVHPASIIAQDVTNFNYNSSVLQLTVGLSGAPFDDDQRVRLAVVGNINDYADAGLQNQSTGDSATGDWFVSADNDNGTLVGHYTDMGITGSGWNPTTAGNIRVISVNAAGTGYTVNDILTVSTGGDGNAQVKVLTINGGGGVTSASVEDNGTGYVTGSGYSTTGGTGSGCKINVLSLLDFTIWGANDGYIYNSGGNLVVSTDTLNKDIIITAGGQGSGNQLARFSPSSVLTIGNTGSIGGQIKFLGKTSGNALLSVSSVAGNSTFILPPNNGSNGNVLITDGNGITAWSASGGSGITRSSSIVSISSTFGAVANTDYVAFANVGISLTLPTAVANKNMYTVKNVSTSSVVILTTSAQTIDGSANVLMPIQNTAVDVLSDGANWNVI